VSNRPFAALLAAAYLLAVTPWLSVGAGLAHAAPAGLHEADFPCAHHRCGCKSAEDCRTHCCCLSRRSGPKRTMVCPLDREHAHARPNAVSYFAAMRCAGHAPAAQLPGSVTLDPHLPQLVDHQSTALTLRDAPRASPACVAPHVVRRIEHVPISSTTSLDHLC